MQLLHCASTASSVQVQAPDSRTQRVFVSGAFFGAVLAFFTFEVRDASLAALPPSAIIFLFLLTERVGRVAKVERRASRSVVLFRFLGFHDERVD